MTPRSITTLPDRVYASLLPKHPPVTIDALAQMLEIDLMLGRREDFLARLKKALQSSYQQGLATSGKSVTLRASGKKR